MKIIEVINVPWWNAAAEYCITITDALSKRGHRTIIVCEKDTPSCRKALQLNLQAETMLSFKPLHFISDLFTIKRAFRTIYNDVQIVNVHTAQAQTIFVVAKLLFNLRFRLIRTRVDSRKIKHHPLNKLSYASLSGIIVSNKADQNEVLSFVKIPSNRVKIIHAGVDINRFKPLNGKSEKRKNFLIPADALVVGNIARRSPVKGHDVFFKAAQLIHEEIKNVFFVTAGVDDTVVLEALKDMAGKAGITDKTLFLDYVDDIEGLINCLDVGVVSSVGSENHSRITLEYMACGVPVVGSDVGNVGELIDHGKTGFVIPKGDFVALADAVIKLLKGKETRELFSYNAHKLASLQFSTNSFAESTELFYTEVIGRKG